MDMIQLQGNAYLIAQYALAEAHNGLDTHNNSTFFENAMELVLDIEQMARSCTPITEIQCLAERAEQLGMKVANDLWEEAAWQISGCQT